MDGLKVRLREIARQAWKRAGQTAGFSLLEIMVVIALIALFSVLVGPAVLDALTDGKKDAARVQIKQFEQGLGLFYKDCGRYPSTAEGLEALINKPADCKGWNKALEGDQVPEDPWGHDFLYYSPPVRSDNPYEIISQGPSVDDSSDDITSFTQSSDG